MVRPVVVSLSALSSLTSKSICEFCPQECPDTQVHLLGKLPNDGSADPLAAIYDVDLAIPADKVVRIFLIISKIEKMALRWMIMFFLQAGLSHMATDVVNSTLGVVLVLRKSPCFNLFPNQHFIFLLRRTATSLSC